MQKLSVKKRALITSLVDQLRQIEGMAAVVLGGSYARGRARLDSDIDLGLLYSELSPFEIEDIRAVANRVNDNPDPVVAGFYDWGPWVNGGAWLTIGGQRVDLLYRNLEQLERVIAQAMAGGYEHCYFQHGPFGFYSDTYLADLQTCEVLFDSTGRLPRLKERLDEYPPALQKNLVRDSVGSTKLDLYGARTFANAGDAYGTAASLVRVVNELVKALFALNGRYRTNDKSAFAELAQFRRLPRDFGPRIQDIFASLDHPASELRSAVDRVEAIAREVEELGEEFLKTDASSPAWFVHVDRAFSREESNKPGKS